MATAVDEDRITAQFLGGAGGFDIGGLGGIGDGDFDAGEKADSVEDYEDISDSNLPEEEEATSPLRDDDALGERLVPTLTGLTGLTDLPDIPHTNGFHDGDHKDQATDLFEETEEVNDLFGEPIVRQVTESRRAEPLGPPSPPIRKPSLALPGNPGLALPSASNGIRQYAALYSQPSPSSLSPQPYAEGTSPAYSGDDGEPDYEHLTAAERQQMELFQESKRRAMGLDVPRASIETDADLFNTLFPTYNEDELPFFTELWKPRPGIYRGKVPLKPPKPVQPTNLTLDLCPDQERMFKTFGSANKGAIEHTGIIEVRDTRAGGNISDDDISLDEIDDNERVGGMTMHDFQVICEDWDTPSLDTASIAHDGARVDREPASPTGDGLVLEPQAAPHLAKKRKFTDFASDTFGVEDLYQSFDDPERAVAKLARSVILDMNDPKLLLDEHAPQTRKKIKHIPGDVRRDAALSRDLSKRYNISNDQAYDLLKENHQSKVRNAIGGVAVEHSMPAARLQYPFYKVSLAGKEKRSFHRKSLDLPDRPGKEYKFAKNKFVKRKHVRGRDVKDLFAKAADLSFDDNANMLLLEYSEEAPIMLSNFGMGSRLINYYRKRNDEDNERPKRDIGETHVLSIQDKGPFSTFGHVEKGEMVPTIHNGMYRAPVFQHSPKPTDFLVSVSTTHEDGSHFHLRNIDNLHTVGQEFPLVEVPGEHSRKVTDAAKKRLRAISYRIYDKVLKGKKGAILDNATMMSHVLGSDTPQIRSKMREFMAYVKGAWVPKPDSAVPDLETVRGWIRPEDICLLDSMQVGVQHLVDLGLGGDEKDEGKDADESDNIEKQLAPWQTTKNFLNACQGKAMLKLHGEGDPTGRGEGFNFVKTSMKGGFQAIGESVEDKLEAKKRRENGGHSYNVQKQQKAYEEYIRKIWEAQKVSLSNEVESSDGEEFEEEEAENGIPFNRGATPRSSIGTPAAFGRHEDDSASVFSRQSGTQGDKVMIITREYVDKYGQPQVTKIRVDNPRVISLYKKRRTQARLKKLAPDAQLNQGEDPEVRAAVMRNLEKELARLERNKARTDARVKAKERAKGIVAQSPAPAGASSPGASDGDGPASMQNGGSTSVEGTPAKGGRGRNKDGTQRKCANCGQVGHIKTNRKLCPLLNGTMKPEDAGFNGDTSFGAVPAQLAL